MADNLDRFNRIALQKLADQFFEDANALLAANRWAAAYYLAGYAIECALKACIASKTQEHDFPDKAFAASIHTHDLAKLLKLAGLEEERREKAEESAQFDFNWQVITGWSEMSRYYPKDQTAAEDLVRAIGDNEEGVFAWIKVHW